MIVHSLKNFSTEAEDMVRREKWNIHSVRHWTSKYDLGLIMILEEYLCKDPFIEADDIVQKRCMTTNGLTEGWMNWQMEWQVNGQKYRWWTIDTCVHHALRQHKNVFVKSWSFYFVLFTHQQIQIFYTSEQWFPIKLEKESINVSNTFQVFSLPANLWIPHTKIL